ncbi:MAG: prolipoprotein diacylglyceryl transferase [Hyphomicrobiales bacterium]|nr:prolipoprotein diacylglyceryl transferase [Hyphomicrobiales bacterium]
MPVVHDFNLEIGSLFGVTVYWYGAVYTLGFLGVLGWFTIRRRRLGWSMADVFEFASLMAAGILIGGRVFDILVYELDFYRADPWTALNWWRGGMASHGVLLGGVLGILVFCRWRNKPFIVTADELAVPAAFFMSVGRLGNFIEGGVIGSLTSVSWGVIYPDVEGPRHPVALYESAKNFLMIPILMVILRRFPAGRGMATGAFVFLYAALRFLVDEFRDYEGGWLGIGQGQYFNLVMAAFGLGILIWALRRPAATATPAPTPTRRVGWLRVVVFTFLCLYPLGIPTSWTRVNIEEIRGATASESLPVNGN